MANDWLISDPLYITSWDIENNLKRAQFESLLDTKLAQLRLSLLEKWLERYG
jgi:hypothetical protein